MINKKMLAVGIVASLMSVTGCASAGAETEQIAEESVVSAKDSQTELSGLEEKREITKILECTVCMKIVDPCPLMYEEELDAELDPELTDSFRTLAESLKPEKGNAGSRTFYLIKFYDEKELLLAEWKVDTQHRIILENGEMISPDSSLENLFSELEESLDITFAVFERAPGTDFLRLLEEAEKGKLTEVTEDNFQEGATYDLDSEDLKELKTHWPDIEIADTESGLEKIRYQIHFYTEKGAELYCLVVGEDGNLYTDTMYQLCGEMVSEWLDNLKRKAGL